MEVVMVRKLSQQEHEVKLHDKRAWRSTVSLSIGIKLKFLCKILHLSREIKFTRYLENVKCYIYSLCL